MGAALEEWYEELVRCNKCGFCQATCPIYVERRDEASVARGRLRLLKAVLDGRLPATEGVAERIYRCLLCAACTTTCPSGVEVDSILQTARQELAAKGLLPQALTQLGHTVLRTHNIGDEDNRWRLIWSEDMERPPAGLKRADLLYFVGCVASFFPTTYGIPRSFTHLLEAAGMEYVLLGGEEWCCGYPLLLNGMVEEAEELVRHNIARAKEAGATRVVVTCPSCYYTWQHLYKEVVGGEMNLEVLHSTQLLAEILAEGRIKVKPLPRRVTYHDPCDLGRKSQLYEPPRRVLESIPGLSLQEMADNRANALCCGGGGNLETFTPALAEAVAGRRLAQARATGAEAIVSACSQCKRTLIGAVRKERARIEVLDVVELVWQAMGDGS